jgi:hypothetical protein
MGVGVWIPQVSFYYPSELTRCTTISIKLMLDRLQESVAKQTVPW